MSSSALVFAGVVQFLLAQQPENLELELADLSAALVSDREHVSTANARKLLRRAGDSHSVALTSELKVIAEQEHLDRLISLGAIDALWRLGESDEYFYRFLESPAVSRVQQVNAIWILARNATEQAARKINSITWHEGDNRLSGAIQVYRYSQRQQKKYSEVTNASARVRFLSPFATRGYNTMRIDENDPETSLFPLTVWAKRELSQLCEAVPSEVASAAAQYLQELKEGLGGQWDRDFESYFQSLLEGKCGEQFREIYFSQR